MTLSPCVVAYSLDTVIVCFVYLTPEVKLQRRWGLVVLGGYTILENDHTGIEGLVRTRLY